MGELSAFRGEKNRSLVGKQSLIWVSCYLLIIISNNLANV
jgi:hypothetical protein